MQNAHDKTLIHKPTTKLGADKTPLDDGLTQAECFMQAVRELECDDDPERFKKRVKKVTFNKCETTHTKNNENITIKK
ncbi:hypothetical protein [Methylobacterium sp. WL120]|uniref:hypothetical protein n=1 Tax=Methylobacterium sp. WL120 TaxID=2603887 RepID=UPI0011C932C9|nr:hypothetical protein [Methylobacterium sp. WL120]TXM62361.1 hypothetical protein FV229_22170 [Methylobacterium sp. WL120]